MISHTMLGTNDLDRADAFYQKIFAIIDAKQIYKSDTVMFWEFEKGGARLAISLPFDGQQASSGNGSMVALQLQSVEQVNHVFVTAISLGAINEGDPGKRESGAYCAYFRDHDGNKIAIFYRE